MSTEYYVDAILGYRFDLEEFNDRFAKKRTERSHMEKRFCPKTGKQLPDKKVIDVAAGTYLFYNNNYFDNDYFELHEAIDHDLRSHGLILCRSQSKDGEVLDVIVGICINKHSPEGIHTKAAHILSIKEAISKIIKVKELPPLLVHPVLTVC
jgi:hypothetical protein